MISIYGLTDPRDGAVRYVGQTCRLPEKRLDEHVKTSGGKKTPKERWIQSLVSKGMVPGTVLIEECADDDCKREKPSGLQHFQKGS